MKYGVGRIGSGEVTHYLWDNGAAYCGSGNVSTGTKARSVSYTDNDVMLELPTCRRCLIKHEVAREVADLPEINQVMRLYESDEYLVYVTEVNDHTWQVKYIDQYGNEAACFPDRLSQPETKLTGRDMPVWTWCEVNGSEDRSYDVCWMVAANPNVDIESVRNRGYVTYRIPRNLRGDLSTVRRIQSAFIKGING